MFTQTCQRDLKIWNVKIFIILDDNQIKKALQTSKKNSNKISTVVLKINVEVAKDKSLNGYTMYNYQMHLLSYRHMEIYLITLNCV